MGENTISSSFSCSSSSAPMLLVSFNSPKKRSISPISPSPTRDLRGVRLFRAIGRKLGKHQRHECSYHRDEEEDCSRSSSTDSDDHSSSSTSEGSGRTSRSKKSNHNKASSSSTSSSSRSVGSSYRSVSCSSSSPGHHHHHHHHHSASSSSGSDTSSSSNHDSGNHSLGRSEAPSTESSSSCSSSSSSSGRHHHSPAVSFRKLFQSLSLTRSHSASCANELSKTSNCSGTTTNSKRRTSNKKSPKRILRSPVQYTYVRGLSGLPTQRVPRGYPCVYMPPTICCETSHFIGQHFSGLRR